MSDHVKYNFADNHQSLGAVNNHLSAIEEIRNDIGQLFQMVKEIYGGAGSASLEEAHTRISNLLDEHTQDAQLSQARAGDQQDLMQQLDLRHSQSF